MAGGNRGQFSEGLRRCQQKNKWREEITGNFLNHYVGVNRKSKWWEGSLGSFSEDLRWC